MTVGNVFAGGSSLALNALLFAAAFATQVAIVPGPGFASVTDEAHEKRDEPWVESYAFNLCVVRAVELEASGIRFRNYKPEHRDGGPAYLSCVLVGRDDRLAQIWVDTRDYPERFPGLDGTTYIRTVSEPVHWHPHPYGSRE